jgi:hypothetical protein
MTNPAHDVTTGPTDEVVTLAGIAALATGSATLAAKVQEHLAKRPFVVQVVDSYFRDGMHVIVLVLHNYGLHALYVEKLTVDDASGVTVRERSNDGSFDMGGATPPPPPSPVLPFRIAPAERRTIDVRIPDKEVAERYATFLFTISRLGEKDEEEEKVVVRLRTMQR